MASKKNSKNKTLVSGTSDGDSIVNSGSTVTIDAGAGNDTVANDHATAVTIFGGDGDDSLYNYYSNRSSIDAGAGNDTILNSGSTVTIDAGEGVDIVANYSGASLAVIDLGADNDSINSSGYGSKIYGGAGADTIINFGANSSLAGGDGNDYISNNAAASLTAIDGGAGNDSIITRADFVTVETGGGADSVNNYGDNVLVNVNGGSARIYNSASALTVAGSDESELVSIAGYNTNPITVQLGGGVDTFVAGYKSSELIQFTGGALDIANYNHDDTIEILSGSVESCDTDGGDLILNISDGGRITLENMTNHAVTVKDSGGTSTKIYSNGYSPLAVIQNFVHSINRSMIAGTNAKMNEAIKACSGFNSMQDVIDRMVADCRAAGSADKFLKDYCGIILENDDVGALTGWDAGGLSAKDSIGIIPETAPADTLDSLTKAAYTRNGLTVFYPQNESTLGADQKKVLQNAYRWWVEEATNLIDETYDFTFDGDVVSLSAVNSSSQTYWGVTYGNYASNAVSLNLYYTDFENEDDQDGNGIDRCLAHELTHVMQNVFLMHFPQFLHEGMAELTIGIDDQRTSRISLVAGNADSLATYLDLSNSSTGDANYYAAGYMFWRYLAKQASDAFDSLKGYARSENATLNGTSDGELLTASGRGLTVDAGAGKDTITAYGSEEVILGGAGVDSIVISSVAGGIRVDAGAGNDRILNYSTGATLDGASGDDIIVNYENGTQSSLLGGAGADSIFNGASDVTIDGGSGDDYIDAYSNGADLIIYSKGGGNDLIANFYGDDTLMITAGFIASQGAVDDDYMVTVAGEGVITLQGAASRVTSKNIIVDADVVINSADGVKVIGTGDADSIINYGERVTIDPGAGDDTMTGSDNGEMYFLSSAYGNNVITNFGAGDSISMISGTQMSGAALGDDYVVTLKGKKYTGSVTLQGAGAYTFKQTGKVLTVETVNAIVNSADKVKVLGTGDVDSIVNYGASVTIDPGAGDDTIEGADFAELYLFSSAYDNNVITNFGAGDSISMTAGTLMSGAVVGDDYVVTLKGRKYSSAVTLQGAGDYTFKQSGKVLTVETVNAIVNSANKVKVLGTGDADSIVNYGASVTIDPGAGDDTLTGSDNGELYLFSSAYDSNVITNFGAGDSISMTAGTLMSGAVVGDDYVVTLKGRKYSSAVTLQGAGDYTFKQTGKVLTVETVNSIVNSANKVKVLGTGDADSIINYGERVTIDPGAGDDTLIGSDNGEMYFLSSAYGNNVITNFGAGDSISMTAGTLMSGAVVGDDYVVTLKGRKYSSAVTLQGASDYTFKQSGKVLTVVAGSTNVADYWFTADEPIVEENALDQIVQSDVALAVPEEPLLDRLNNPIAPSIVGLTQSARHRLKK